MIKTYSELITFRTFEERFQYLKLLDRFVGEDTFGYDRYLNQKFYRSKEWRRLRDELIIRDNGCDLGIPGYEIYDKVIIHHMNPIRKEDLLHPSDYLMNPEYLICTTPITHNAIHFGDKDTLISSPICRVKNDTCPWKK